MGYFLISEAEDAVTATSLATPKTHTPFPRMQERGLRFYSPGLGRWTSRDPVDEVGSLNLYVLANNSTISGTDYLGLYRIPYFDCDTLAGLEARLEWLKTQALALAQMRLNALAALRNPNITLAQAANYRSILASVGQQWAQLSGEIATIAAYIAGAEVTATCCCAAGAGAVGAGAGCLINRIPVGGGNHMIDWWEAVWHWMGF